MKRTIKDIAESCGVSIALVSRIMNGDNTLKFRPETREKVLREIEKQAYVPDFSARRLANHSLKSPNDIRIGYITYKGAEMQVNAYFDRIIEGIKSVLDKENYQVTRFYVDEVVALFREGKPLADKRFDGMILFGDLPDKLMRYLSGYVKYFSSIYGQVREDVDFVGVDLMTSMNTMLDYIKSLGYTRFGLVFGGDKRRDVVVNLYAEEIGLTLDDKYSFNGEYNYKQAYSEMAKLLSAGEKPPKIMCCMNDEMAIGVMDALLEAGYSVPADVSVTGHDDILRSNYSKVSLTTLRIYKEEIGRLVTEMLLDRINHKRKFPVKVFLPSEVVVRRSTQKNMAGKNHE